MHIGSPGSWLPCTAATKRFGAAAPRLHQVLLRGLFRLPLISKQSMQEVELEEGKAGEGGGCQEANTVFSGNSQQDKSVKRSINLQQLSALDILTVSASKIHDLLLGGR